jgi:hypothetical protein
MGGYATNSQGEGAKMVDGCNPDFFIKTEISKCMMCICHEDNTIDKDKFNKDDILVNDIDLDRIPQIKIVREMFN